MSDSIDVNEGRGGVGFRIRHLWAMVAVHADEDEGVIAFMGPGGQWIPLVAADEKRLEEIVKLGRQVGRESNKVVRLWFAGTCATTSRRSIRTAGATEQGTDERARRCSAAGGGGGGVARP